MNETFFVLGRQPELGIAELEKKFPNYDLKIINPKIISIEGNLEPEIIDTLGGTLKVGYLIKRIRKTANIDSILTDELIAQICSQADGKITFGISYFGVDRTHQDIQKLALSVKRLVKKRDRSMRVVPNVEVELSTAQITHNRLINHSGFELNIVNNSEETILFKTMSVQNIGAYSARDQSRPFRDAKIGMLPPKLAQIMINLVNPGSKSTLLDPFCGSGVILQESLLMDISVIGSDLNPRMVEYASGNIEWLRKKYQNLPSSYIFEGDSTKITWNDRFDCVVTESFLGKPFFSQPPPQIIETEVHLVSNTIKAFLQNIHKQSSPGLKLCVAVPAWYINKNYIHLPILDHLDKIGYNLMSFKNVSADSLIYHRPNQIVARQLLTLVRK